MSPERTHYLHDTAKRENELRLQGTIFFFFFLLINPRTSVKSHCTSYFWHRSGKTMNMSV